MFSTYKPRFTETAAAENPARARSTNKPAKKEKNFDALSEYLTKRGIKVAEVSKKASNGDLVIRIQGGGNDYRSEIKKAIMSLEMDEAYDLNRIEKYLVDQTDDYNYFIPEKKEPLKVTSNVYVSRDEKI